MSQEKITIMEKDMNMLSNLVDSIRCTRRGEQDQVVALRNELDRAEITDGAKPPRKVVTMNSTIWVTDLDTGEDHRYQLVFPRDADFSRKRISVLAPIGTALLGYSVGSRIEWSVPGGVRRLLIKRVKHAGKKARAQQAA
jgi:regulator of nucleoside diphosphate kinase